jgi:hypothetical protein
MNSNLCENALAINIAHLASIHSFSLLPRIALFSINMAYATDDSMC